MKSIFEIYKFTLEACCDCHNASLKQVFEKVRADGDSNLQPLALVFFQRDILNLGILYLYFAVILLSKCSCSISDMCGLNLIIISHDW